jgi:Flp pilus assembly protein TadG
MLSRLNRKSPRLRRSRRGAIVVLVAACLCILLVCAAISLDGGGLLEQRRKAQATADAAALAAAEDLFRNFATNKGVDVGGTAATRAVSIASANGFDNNGTSSVVTVRTYPQLYLGGPNKNTVVPKGYVEVTVQRNQSRYFSSVIGAGTIPVSARAAAKGAWAPAFIGIHVLDLHDPSALRGTGGGYGNVTGGAAVIVNSDSVTAGVTTGGSILRADDFSIVGGIDGTGFIGDVHLGMEPQPDPLRNIPQPTRSSLPDQSSGPKHYSNGNRIISPGVYHGGIDITGQANVTMLPGIYYMDGGGFNFSGQGNLVANGVMIYNDPSGPSDNISLTGSNGGSVTMSPPTSGTYKGMTLFQNRTATNVMNISGNGSFSVTGTFYTADSLMNVSGNGDAHIGSQYISRYLDLNGNGGMVIDYNPDQVVPRRVLNLVE